MTIPNLITVIRIILAPVFIVYMINDQLLYALIIFLICSLTDGIDGMVARFFNQKSNLGAYLDPLADKLLLDVMILLGLLILLLNRLDFKMKPSMISKINTCFQFLLLIFLLGKDYLHFPPKFYSVFFYLTALFTISSGLHYMYYWFKILGDGLGSDHKKSDD